MKFAILALAFTSLPGLQLTHAEDAEHPVLKRVEEITIPKRDEAAKKESTTATIGCIIVEERPLKQVLDYLSTVSGMNIKLQSENLSKILVGKDCFVGENNTYHDILETICRKHKLKLDESRIKDKIIYVFRPESITLTFKDADVREVVFTIAAAGNLNVVIDPEVQGKVTANLKDVACIDALEVVTKSLGYVTVQEKGTLRVNEK